jgi:hypothetical protein
MLLLVDLPEWGHVQLLRTLFQVYTWYIHGIYMEHLLVLSYAWYMSNHSIISIALSSPTQRRPSCYAHTTRVPAPPIPSGWGGLIYGIRWRWWIPLSSRDWSPLRKGPGGAWRLCLIHWLTGCCQCSDSTFSTTIRCACAVLQVCAVWGWSPRGFKGWMKEQVKSERYEMGWGRFNICQVWFWHMACIWLYNVIYARPMLTIYLAYERVLHISIKCISSICNSWFSVGFVQL